MHERVLLIVAMVIVAAASTGAMAEDSLDRRLARISPKAVDCGSTGEGEPNRAAVNACVRENFVKNRAFRARFGGRCEDSICATALVLESPPGGVYVVQFDSEGCKAVNASDPFCGTWVEPCNKPVLVPKGKGLKVVCRNEYGL